MSTNKDAVRLGRPPGMEDPKGTSIVLDRIHRDLVERHRKVRNLGSVGEAVRDIIERFFKLK